MTRLNDIIQKSRKHTGKIIGGAILIGLIGSTSLRFKSCIDECSNWIDYKKIVKTKGLITELTYEEDARWHWSGRPNTKYNKMIISDGNTTYILIDNNYANWIFWKYDDNLEYLTDKLDKIIIKTPSKTREYEARYIHHRGNVEQLYAEQIFNESNKLYNTLRTQIREELRTMSRKKLESTIPMPKY